MAFRLNLFQHYIFETMARHLLSCYSGDIALENQNDLKEQLIHINPNMGYLKEQLIGYSGGEAGSGKSAIISATLTFATLWGRRNTVETMAPSGVAGLLVQGDTVHRNRGLNIAFVRSNSTVIQKQILAVYLSIIDEGSMLPQQLLGEADEVTRDIRQNNKPWGGRHIMIFSDLLQLPPVLAKPIYENVTEDQNNSRSNAAHVLWNSINFIAFLTDVWRQHKDPQFLDILHRTHWGVNTAADLEVLNTRTVHECYETDTTPIVMPLNLQHQHYFAPMVSPINKDRCSYLRVHNHNHAKKCGIHLFEIMAKPANKNKEALIRNLSYMDDDNTDKIPLMFFGYIGMPVMITKRYKNELSIEKLKLIANGTIGFIVDFTPDYDNGSTDEDLYHTRYVNGVKIRRYKLIPKLMWLLIRGCNHVLCPGYPPGIVGLPPLKRSVTIKLPGKKFSIMLTQFPAISANALTPEKLQGITLPHHLFVGKLDRYGFTGQCFYVVLSRVIALLWLVFTEPLEMNYVRKFLPPLSVLYTMKDLMSRINLPSYMTPEQLIAFNNWKQRELTYCNEAIKLVQQKLKRQKKGKNNNDDDEEQNDSHTQQRSTQPISTHTTGSITCVFPLHTISDEGMYFSQEHIEKYTSTPDMDDDCWCETYRCFFIHLGIITSIF